MKAHDAWRESAGQAWVELQARTDAQLEPLGRRALERLDPQPGERALDVGCGAGQTTVELARRVGAAGKVTAIDISEPMVAAARERVAQAQLGNVQTVLADAASYTFDTQFDGIYSRFGVMFFADSVAAFRNLHAALKRQGRIAFVCWQALELNDWASVPLNAVRSLVPDQPLPALLEPGQPGPFSFSDPAFVHELLTAAGFQRIMIELHTDSIQLGATQSVAEATDYCLQIGPAARLIADADRSLLPAFKRALNDAIAPYATAEGVKMMAQWMVVSAHAS